MNLLKHTIHSSIDTIDNKTIWERPATRAIILRNKKILLLYTERYDDYSLPGGGVNEGEEIIEAFKRELKEETGAKNIRNIQEFGKYEEYRVSRKVGFDLVFMTSYCYTCEIDENLGETQYESYELSNGMKPVWLDIDQAILHNEQTLAQSPKSGLSIERELFLLKKIKEEFFFTTA